MKKHLTLYFGIRTFCRCVSAYGVKNIGTSCLAALYIILASVSYCQAVSITTIEQLQAIKDNLSGSYELENDIDASITRTWDNATGTPKGFAPLGVDANAFSGTFNGKGHVIRNLYINRPAENNVGLFGTFWNGAAVSDLGLDNATVAGYASVGGLAGNVYGSSITDCYSTGIVNGTIVVGGLVGSADAATITNCYSTSPVTGTGEDAGGLVGTGGLGGSINTCFSTGAVSSSQKVGGLVGSFTGYINNCYSTGAVTGTGDYVGGLAGFLQYSQTNAYISHCYSTGAVTGTGGNVGGLVGYNRNSTDSIACFWDTQTSGKTSSILGTGLATGGMKTEKNFTDQAWDFADNGTWCMIDNITYPQLRWRSANINLQNDSFAMLQSDGALSVDAAHGVLANDTATAASLAAMLVSGPGHGTLHLSDNGSFRYTPDSGYSGQDSFTYSSPGSCTAAAVVIDVVCSYALSQEGASIAAAGGTGSFGIAAGSLCSWTAVKDSDWISISPASGTGSGTITYTVAENTGAGRTATITVEGKTFTVNQAAAQSNSCTLMISPDTVAVRLAGTGSADSGTAARLFRYGGPLRIFRITGAEDAVFKRTDRPQWNADTIKTLLAFRVRANTIIALVFINPLTTKAGEYGLAVGDCTGTIAVEDL